MQIGGGRSLHAPPPRSTTAVDFALNRSSTSPCVARSSSAPSLFDVQVPRAGVSTERLSTPTSFKRGIVPIGLHAQRPDEFRERGRVSSPVAKASTGVQEHSMFNARPGAYAVRGAELRDGCKQFSLAQPKQEALAAIEALGKPPGIEHCARKGAGACSPRGSSSQRRANSLTPSASEKGLAARSCAGFGHQYDITVACSKGQGSCSPRNESHARYIAQRDRSFERRQEGVRLGSPDIEAVPRSRPGTCSPRRVRQGTDSSSKLSTTNLAAEDARLAHRATSTKNVPRSVTPRRFSWPEPQDFLAMIGAEPAQGRTTPGAPRLAGAVLADIRASVPRPPSRERDPALHTLLRQERMRSRPPPRCVSSKQSIRDQHAEVDLQKLHGRLGMMLEQQANSSASCGSAEDFSPVSSPVSARMTHKMKAELDGNIFGMLTSGYPSMPSARSGETGGMQEARATNARNDSEYEEALSTTYAWRAADSICSTAGSSTALSTTYAWRAADSLCSTAGSSTATNPPVAAEEKPISSGGNLPKWMYLQ